MANIRHILGQIFGRSPEDRASLGDVQEIGAVVADLADRVAKLARALLTRGGGPSPSSAAADQEIGAHVRRSTNQSTTSGATAILSFDIEDYDSGGCFTPAQPTRLTAPVAGKYQIQACLNWLFNAVGIRRAEILLDGVTPQVVDTRQAVTEGTIDTSNLVVIELNMTAGQYVEVRVLQNSGGPLSVEGGNGLIFYSPNFSMRKVN